MSLFEGPPTRPLTWTIKFKLTTSIIFVKINDVAIFALSLVISFTVVFAETVSPVHLTLIEPIADSVSAVQKPPCKY
jgi:hypothetical protein